MAKIKQLSPHEAQKIAAGEVVERPAHVVKELIENGIDADATTIAVYLEDGGKKLIRIVDNGCGMSPEDAHLCFGQHTTSKITRVDDLEKISTFGFRGEALASIAAVSDVTLITKEQQQDDTKTTDNLSGIKLTLKAGSVVDQQAVSCTAGTDISIENLFYNVPARQKFLKKKETESRRIIQLLHAFCLDYLTIHFTFFQNGKKILNCPPAQDVITRIAQLWDHTLSKQMIPIETPNDPGKPKISGAISNHQYFRYDRNTLFFFVNKRWVKNYHLSRALLKGYLNVMPPARYPAACIFIDIDPTQVDINIHPRKEEVQFLHPRTVTSLLHNTVKAALEQHLSAQINQKVSIASTSFLNTTRQATPHNDLAQEGFRINTQPSTTRGVSLPFDTIISTDPFATGPTNTTQETAQKNSTTVIEEKEKTDTETQIPIEAATQSSQTKQQNNYQLIGQYHKTYILLEKPNGLFVIDQHAAHERVLYELFSQRFDSVATVKLLFPHIISLSSDDMSTVAPHLNIFKQSGIEIEPFGDNQLVVQATPVHIKNIDISDLVKQVAAWVRQYGQLEQQQFCKKINEKMHAQMACKAAVKAGDTLSREQITTLLDDLNKTTNRFTCPHGRPTGWLLSLYEIEKKFKRKL